MATEDPGGSGEADLFAASEGPDASLSSTGSCDRSLHDPFATALVDVEVRGGHADAAAAKISVKRVHGVCVTACCKSELRYLPLSHGRILSEA